MFESDQKHRHFPASARKRCFVLAGFILAAKFGAAQFPASLIPQAPPETPAVALPAFSGVSSLSGRVVTSARLTQVSNSAGTGVLSGADSTGDHLVQSGPHRRITLAQAKQQSANRLVSPLAQMSHLSVEAAKQHRLEVEADYFPKFGSTFLNLHTTDFLGQIVQVRRPFLGTITQVPVQIVNQNQTMAALTFVQPITPLFEVRQAVRIARADERIAMAKAAASVSKNARDAEIEETYFRLLIAQRLLTSSEWKFASGGNQPLYASSSDAVLHVSGQASEAINAKKAVETASAEVREMTASLNRLIGWPENTELELSVPDPLVEDVSLQEVADRPSSANPALVEAEQTVVKARAASTISKMAYFPTVAAVGGYLFQNVLPAVNSQFGYGGVMASYTLFDFGKREHAVKAARAQAEMAEMALQLTKAKLAADIKKSYSELERSRQLSNLAQKMGTSTALLMRVSSGAESPEVRAARADVEAEMLEADLAHRQAFNQLKALTGLDR